MYENKSLSQYREEREMFIYAYLQKIKSWNQRERVEGESTGGSRYPRMNDI